MLLVICRNCRSVKEYNILLDGQSEGEEWQQQQCLRRCCKTFRFSMSYVMSVGNSCSLLVEAVDLRRSLAFFSSAGT